MTFGESIDRTRSRCIEVLTERITERGAGGRCVIVEAALRDASGSIVSAPDGLKLPLRYDLAYQDSSGKFQTENADSLTIEFGEPLFVTWEDVLKIEIHRLCWDYMQFEIPSGSIPTWDWLRDWFLKWFDAEDVRDTGADGFYGVVHFVSDPQIEYGVARLFVDFGSAGVDAFAEFLDALVRIGATECVIGKKKSA